MSEIKRYDLEDASRGHNAWQDMFERPDGDWMKYADHLAELARLRSIIHDYEISEPIATNYGLQQELSRLREELNECVKIMDECCEFIPEYKAFPLLHDTVDRMKEAAK